MSLPETYCVQESCVVCVWVYIWSQQDEIPECHCTKYASPRPPDGSYGRAEENWVSIMMEKHPKVSPQSEEYTTLFVGMMDAWREWSKEHRVETCGKCKEWSRR
jgi:hypothetical protein